MMVGERREGASNELLQGVTESMGSKASGLPEYCAVPYNLMNWTDNRPRNQRNFFISKILRFQTPPG
jgi:hypothetical protein